jgi:hypothetical protein
LIINMPERVEVEERDLEERICKKVFLTVYAFDFNIDVHVLECDPTGTLDFGRSRGCAANCARSVGSRLLRFRDLENVDLAMSKLWLYRLPAAFGVYLDRVTKLQIVESMPFAGIHEWVELFDPPKAVGLRKMIPRS